MLGLAVAEKQCCAGLALKYNCPLGVHLSPAFVKQLMRRSLTKADMVQIHPEAYASIEAIRGASDEELQQMCLTFEQPDGKAFKGQSAGKCRLPHALCTSRCRSRNWCASFGTTADHYEPSLCRRQYGSMPSAHILLLRSFVFALLRSWHCLH